MSEEVDVNKSAAVNVAKLLGARQAMGLIAGRCSAAHAGLLSQIHDKKEYLSLSESWEAFCQEHLHMSRRHADRMIKLYQELGPSYFELTQLTRISPQEYRAIAAHVDGQSIHINGEAIALIEANSEKVAAAVSELRAKSAPEQEPEPRPVCLSTLKRRCDRLTDEFTRLRDEGADAKELRSIASHMAIAFAELQLSLSRPKPRS
jgi:hypothetical protein